MSTNASFSNLTISLQCQVQTLKHVKMKTISALKLCIPINLHVLNHLEMSYSSWVIPIYKNIPVFDYVTSVHAIWCLLFIFSRRDETVRPKMCYLHNADAMLPRQWHMPVDLLFQWWQQVHTDLPISIHLLNIYWAPVLCQGSGEKPGIEAVVSWILDLWDPVMHNPSQLSVWWHHVGNLQLAMVGVFISQQPTTL